MIGEATTTTTVGLLLTKGLALWVTTCLPMHNGTTADSFGAWNNNTDTYNSALKLPSAGYRDRIDGLLYDQGTNGHYWSSTVSGTNARTCTSAAQQPTPIPTTIVLRLYCPLPQKLELLAFLWWLLEPPLFNTAKRSIFF
jgi:hypothetical protein